MNFHICIIKKYKNHTHEKKTIPTKLNCVFLSLQTALWGQYPNPPIAICNDNMQVNLSPITGKATVFAEDFDEGTYDLCTKIILTIDILDGQITELSTSKEVAIENIGNFIALLSVEDEVGNQNNRK